ncbi:MAG: MFS transporter [Chloroflexi bacterium]|nr:MFS transporter [Chloroflexota bacterium]MBV9898735.1 MFS transporter [Chloroflexota bacterium]
MTTSSYIERTRPGLGLRPLGLLLLTLVATAALMALDLAVQSFTFQVVQQTVVFLAVMAIQLFGLQLGASRARLGTAFSVAVALPLIVWLAVVWALAPARAFQSIVALPVGIFLPLVIGLLLLLRSQRVGQWLDAFPASWLVGVQAYRIFGSVFLVGWLTGNLPGVFAVPAGAGDTLVGILALPVAALLAGRTSGARTAAIAWNVLGILDLLDAVALGFLSSPGPQQLIHTGLTGPNPLGAYPLVMIPAFAVPMSLLMHALSLRQLRRATSWRNAQA